MHTLSRIGAAVAVVVASFVPSAASAYPDPTVTITLDPAACADEDLPFVAEASVGGSWSVTYAGQTAEGSGSRISGTFTTSPSDAGTSHVPVATLEYDDTAAQADAAPGVDAAATVSASTTVALDTCGARQPTGNGLPGTGAGLTPWWLLLAAGLLCAGTALVTWRRGARQ